MGIRNHTQPQQVSLKKRVLSLPTLLSFGIAIVFVGFLATRFNLDWSATWENIRTMNPWLYLLAFFLYYLSFLFRGLRWKILAMNADQDPTSGIRLPSVPHFSQLIVIGWFVNSITWLRLGDAYRAYAFAEDSNGKFSWSLGTVLAERVLDTVTIFAVLVLSAIFISTTIGSNASGYILVAAFAMVLILVSLLLFMRKFGNRLARFLPGRLEGGYHRFQQGTLGSFKQLRLLLALGLIGWILEIARLYFVIQALDISIGLALIPVVALGHAILSTVPTPGGVGAVEPGVTGLLALSLERHDAVSVALVDRSITYVSVIAIGGLVFVARQILRSRAESRQALATNASAND